MEGRNEEAIALLERYLKNWADDALHTKLAQVFAATDKLGDSLSHYQTALRYKEISPNSSPSSSVLNVCNFMRVVMFYLPFHFSNFYIRFLYSSKCEFASFFRDDLFTLCVAA